MHETRLKATQPRSPSLFDVRVCCYSQPVCLRVCECSIWVRTPGLGTMNRKTPGEAVVRTSSLGGVPGPSRSHAHRHHQSSLALLLSHSGTDPCLQRQNGEKWLPTNASGTSGQMKSREEPLNRGETF